MNNRQQHMLFVDDNPGDHELAREALAETAKGTQIHTVHDGIEALEFLRKAGKHSGAPTPDVVLLDLNMPRKDGIETLKEIRSDQMLSELPVIIFSSSTADSDKQQAQLHKADDYIIKPLALDDFIQTIAQIEMDWCKIETITQEEKP